MFNSESILCKCPACSNLYDGKEKELIWAPIWHRFIPTVFRSQHPCPFMTVYDALASQIPLLATVFAHFLVNQLRRLGDCVFWCCLCVQSRAASWTHVSLPFTAYSTPSTSPANRFVSVGPRDPSFVNIPQQTQVGRSHLFCMWCSLFYSSGAL